MKFKEIANRLTGISCSVFGVQWNPPELDVTKARRVLTFLEDRRVLYNPDSVEVPEHCVRSVIEIRQMLTSELGSLDSDSELSHSLRAMRSACRKFLDTAHENDGRIITDSRHHGHWTSWIFFPALGEMRGVFGIYIAILALQYGLDIEGKLGSILPLEDRDEREDSYLDYR